MFFMKYLVKIRESFTMIVIWNICYFRVDRVYGNYLNYFHKEPFMISHSKTQCAKSILNKIPKAINKTHTLAGA